MDLLLARELTEQKRLEYEREKEITEQKRLELEILKQKRLDLELLDQKVYELEQKITVLSEEKLIELKLKKIQEIMEQKKLAYEMKRLELDMT